VGGEPGRRRPQELQNQILAGPLATTFPAYNEHVKTSFFSHCWEGPHKEAPEARQSGFGRAPGNHVLNIEGTCENRPFGHLYGGGPQEDSLRAPKSDSGRAPGDCVSFIQRTCENVHIFGHLWGWSPVGGVPRSSTNRFWQGSWQPRFQYRRNM
jgi:hypothetical protein